ncbi:hypothetical protein RFI_16768 [Reticulomyxa filosa]|uniref:Uncharacterized protein n=1 Tax=Reticulomyxa filosa TaxID=46433 RepID=X6N3Y4_RETFI|nr:hypothetical protein RFI_16768 [Reticulomyxa filosa]|eukprot:ETO20449.1 hypothetical protein RFI_16768 [Reticulomyxa filosa]
MFSKNCCEIVCLRKKISTVERVSIHTIFFFAKTMTNSPKFDESEIQSTLLENPVVRTRALERRTNSKASSSSVVSIVEDDAELKMKNKRANSTNYRAFGNYLNQVLCQHGLCDESIKINWNFETTQDKVDVVNVIFELLESKAALSQLVAQLRDSMNGLKRAHNEMELKVKSCESKKKKLETELHASNHGSLHQ